jgi:lipopolysaccharide/colanic/teichoic acid biosynthesis glycosyltransferase
MYQRFGKRFIDLLISLWGLVLLSPLLLAITVVVWLANQGSPFFRQRRPGLNEKLFILIKFKTMNDKRSVSGELLPDTERLTSVGKFIRASSLDELPQLWNVLVGDMSLIGPRPLLVGYLKLYTPEQRKRHAIRPGITGWAQVNGRNTLSWEAKFAFDVWYVKHLSLGLDIKIILLTIGKVVRREGITSDTSATMEKFTGKAEAR